MIGHKVGVWVDYTGRRFKEPYDLELKNGTILKSMYPNADSWSYRGDNKDRLNFILTNFTNNRSYIHDEQVKKVRLLTDKDIVERDMWHFTGEERKKRISVLFGEEMDNI